LPLVVVLHGCLQTARDYDEGSGWGSVAALKLALPEL
jgi:poly(3-hydroxybutyrate) depolymerase